MCPENKPKQFVYFWERPDLHWFLNKLRGTYEIVIWSSLGRVLTSKIVEVIERENSYFAYVLSRANTQNYTDRKPTNIVMAQATLMVAKNSDTQKTLEMSFSSINKALYPGGKLRDLALLSKNRELDSVSVLDCNSEALMYMQKKGIKV